MCCPRAADSGRRHGSRLPVAACVPTSQEKAVSGHCGRHEVGVGERQSERGAAEVFERRASSKKARPTFDSLRSPQLSPLSL